LGEAPTSYLIIPESCLAGVSLTTCMSTPATGPTTINYNGDTFTIPAWMQTKAGTEGLTRSDLEQIAPIPADEEPYAITGEGNKIITNGESLPIREGQQIGSVARFTAAGHLDDINVRRVNNELQILQSGVQRPVNWTADLRFVVIEAVQLPANCRVAANGRQHDHTNVMIVVPKGYGFGVPLKESYVNPGLRCLHGGEWVEPPHYFDEAKKFHRTEGAREKDWRYMCIEFTSWKPTSSFLTYLDALFLFLSDPWKYPHQH